MMEKVNIIYSSRKSVAIELKPDGITIRNQRSRWGSCSNKGNLNFNCLLMLFPEVVDEMLTILGDRNTIICKKEAEQAQAKVNEIYRFGLDIE